jgi:methionyl aminopeptidase
LLPEELETLRVVGRIAAVIRELARTLATAGRNVYDLSTTLESEIERQGAQLAFPVQCSCNDVAAHDCATADGGACLQIGDLAKIDIGAQIEGWIADTAVTVDVGASGRQTPLIEAAEAALTAGIAAARPGGSVRAISETIERVVRSRGFEPLRDLCGHGLGRYKIHAPPPIPNLAVGSLGVLEPGTIVAIETFVTSGSGIVRPSGAAAIFRVDPQVDRIDLDEDVLAVLRAQRGLPFSHRQFGRIPRARIDQALAALDQRGNLVRYPPLVQIDGCPVAQAEHTLVIGENDVEVVTR